MEDFDPDLIPDEHSDFSLAVRYAREWVIWALCGFKYRTIEEVNQIADICEFECPYYDPTGTCGICGCPIKRKVARDSKPAYVSTYCPHPKPKWLSKIWWINRFLANAKLGKKSSDLNSYNN